MRACALHKLHRAGDRLGEQISIQLMQGSEYVADASPSATPAATVRAFVTATSHQVRTSGNNANSGHNIELRGATHAAKFLTSACPFTVGTGSIVTRFDEQGDAVERFRVVAVLPYGWDRTILLMTAA